MQEINVNEMSDSQNGNLMDNQPSNNKIQEVNAVEMARMFTTKEIAHIFHVHVNQITMWRDMRILEGIHTGRNIMYSQREILEFQERFRGYDISNRKAILETLQQMKGVRHDR